jgi:hypothetical protein
MRRNLLFVLSLTLASVNVLQAQIVGPITFDTAATAGTVFNTTYNFSSAGGTSTTSVTSGAGFAVGATGNHSYIYDATPGEYGTLTNFGSGAITVSMRVSAATAANSFSIHFFDPTTLSSATDTSVDSLTALLSVDSGSGSDALRFYKDGAPGTSGWLGTQITTGITGTGGTFGTVPGTGGATNAYYDATSAGFNLSTTGSELFYQWTVTYNPAAQTFVSTINGLSATYAVVSGDLIGAGTANLGVGFGLRGTTNRIDDFAVSAIPEPSTYALIGIGLVSLLALRRAAKRRQSA